MLHDSSTFMKDTYLVISLNIKESYRNNNSVLIMIHDKGRVIIS